MSSEQPGKVQSLWGDLSGLRSIVPPSKFVEDQAESLKEATRGLVELEITKSRRGPYYLFEADLVAQGAGYKKQLLTLKHDPKIYPLIMHDPFSEIDINCHSEADFREKLEKHISSEKTKDAVCEVLAFIRINSE